MHKVPTNINIKKVRRKLMKINGLVNIHHFHVWQHNNDIIIGTLHIVVQVETDIPEIIKKVEKVLHKSKIHTTTIQTEISDEFNNCSNTICTKRECHDNMCCDDY